jgi:hypothetical protein
VAPISGTDMASMLMLLIPRNKKHDGEVASNGMTSKFYENSFNDLKVINQTFKHKDSRDEIHFMHCRIQIIRPYSKLKYCRRT